MGVHKPIAGVLDRRTGAILVSDLFSSIPPHNPPSAHHERDESERLPVEDAENQPISSPQPAVNQETLAQARDRCAKRMSFEGVY